MTTLQVILAVLGLILGGGMIAALLQFLGNKNKIKAETDNLVLKGAQELVEPLMTRLDEIKKENEAIRVENKQLLGRIESLEVASHDKDNRIMALENENRDKDRKIHEQDEQIVALRDRLNKAIFDAREATQARAERIERIVYLEAQIESLQDQIKKIEKKTGPLNGEKNE